MLFQVERKRDIDSESCFFPNLLSLMRLMRNYKLNKKREALCITRIDEFGLRIVPASSD